MALSPQTKGRRKSDHEKFYLERRIHSLEVNVRPLLWASGILGTVIGATLAKVAEILLEKFLK